MTVVPYDRAVLAEARNSTRAQFAADWLLDPAEIANRIGGTDFVPKPLRNNLAAITAALLYGAEVGLGPMMSLSRIAVIDGRPALYAEAQRALILADGHDLWIEEQTNNRCTIAGRRRGSEMTSRVTWTIDDAKRAKIAGRPNWQAYPRQMLLARASAELARAIFADVIGGLAAREEIEDGDVDVVDAPALVGGTTPPELKPATRRRRRVGTTAGSSPSSSASTTDPGPPPPSAEPEPVAHAVAAEGTEPAGEQPEPEPAPEPQPEPGPTDPTAPADPDLPNRAQLGMMFALYTQKGVNERDAKLTFAEKAVGRKITSSKELSALDVSRIIEALNAEPDAPKPAEPDAPAQATLPANEQAVMDALRDELDAKPANPPYGEFPEGY
jgi:hypothetical protein